MADTLIQIPSATISMTALYPEAPTIVDAGDMTLETLAPQIVVGFRPEDLAGSALIFRCILTGAADELPDLEVPIYFFSATVRDGDPTYVSAQVPSGSTYEEEIAARSHGDIVIRSGLRLANGNEYLEEIARVSYETMAWERTGKTDTITISGHKTVTTGQSKEWTMTGTSYLSMDDAGQRHVRGEIDFRLRCGDILTYGEDEPMIVGSISYTVSARPPLAIMEVVEA